MFEEAQMGTVRLLQVIGFRQRIHDEILPCDRKSKTKAKKPSHVGMIQRPTRNGRYKDSCERFSGGGALRTYHNPMTAY
jgi:hypothetical protein